MNKNKSLAFFLSFIPGVGHLYLERKVRAFLYAAGFFGSLFLGLVLTFISYDEGFFFFGGMLALLAGAVNMIDMIITLSSMPKYENPSYTEESRYSVMNKSNNQHNERFFTILLSFIPGLGHFQLGLTNRGLTFLAGFFGLFTMIGFVTVVINEAFAVFLAAMPVIWLYSLFDCIQMLNRKQKGEELEDRSVFEDLERQRETGKKSKVAATLLSIFPGAGHLYLGLQKRGLQLMAGFLISLYILDVLRLSLFLFFIPLIWFYSFFDALQNVSKYNEDEELEDTPIFDWFIHHQKWLGYGLLALGIYYLFDEVILYYIDTYVVQDFDIRYTFGQYFQTTLISVLFIVGGIKLLKGNKKKKYGGRK
ncbi:hypothetical protein [Chengkuizengella axinellae]|uniref:Multi-TM2 domain-containing protein n=1 Tax=Chengkuizengella axinellae TaxID=3064388 RepID=A0ABT9J1I1_9BACL|nr:hypothetical protein [Chengkuizengella sp. 2205SS18-9]MDP5275338.1 hypothetical protein [Chengkuizengella sp. 2205SS18-9]